MDEIWKDVVGFEGLYEVSDLGNVRSLSRETLVNGGYRMSVGRPLVPILNNRYLTVSLYRRRGQEPKRVHILVVEAFIGPRPDGMQVRHLDGVPTNVNLSNLVYGTPKENQADRVSHGTASRGESHGCAVLSEFYVRMIFSLRGVVSRQRLAKAFGVTVPNIGYIHRGKNWTHVTSTMVLD